MAYPTLVPNSIDFDLGQMNISEQRTISSGPIRFRHSLRTTGYDLQLTYNALTQAQVESLRSHYISVDGTFSEFTVPESIWGGLTVAASTSTYKYNGPPEEIHTGLHYQVQVRLRVIYGVNLLYNLQCGSATQSTIAATAFSSFAFQGYAPFILKCGGANLSSTPAALILECKGADR